MTRESSLLGYLKPLLATDFFYLLLLILSSSSLVVCLSSAGGTIRAIAVHKNLVP
jgi:hypothetical protein